MEEYFFPFQTTSDPPMRLPLGRFMPLIPAGMIKSWLNQNIEPGTWVIDPIGTSPLPALEAAEAGYLVLTAVNNPIIRFMLEVLSQSPQPSSFKAALANLSSIRRGSERLENYFANMYLTECSKCHRAIPIRCFLWRNEQSQPYARVYTCEHCGDSGEYPLTPNDLERLENLGNINLHRARALQRISLGDIQPPAGALEALSAYTPRSLDFIFTLLNKLESLPIEENRKQLLLALALSVCDQGNALWGWPNSRLHPRLLTIPNPYQEKNLWSAMEESIADWTSVSSSIAITTWPQLPNDHKGICIFPGRIKQLIPEISETISPQAAISVLPRPNQAFWTLSAVWAGWIWGKEAVVPLKSALERRRYDWQWHANALLNSMKPLRQIMGSDFPFFAILPEIAPEFLSASAISMEAAGFQIKGLAIREEEQIAQISWSATTSSHNRHKTQSIKLICKESITDLFKKTGQPATYLLIYTACLLALKQNGHLIQNQNDADLTMVSEFQKCLSELLTDESFLIRYQSTAQTKNTGVWWLASPPPSITLPLADKIEIEVVRYLSKNESCSRFELENSLCQKFKGLLTPEKSMIDACLDSYGITTGGPENRFQLRENETPTVRRKDLEEIKDLLIYLGTRMGLNGVILEDSILWKNSANSELYQFFPVASSVISKFLFNPMNSQNPHSRKIIVFPGSRAQLLSFKLHNDPFRQQISRSWTFVKYRHLRNLAERSDMSMSLFSNLIHQDPPEYNEVTQMPLL